MKKGTHFCPFYPAPRRENKSNQQQTNKDTWTEKHLNWIRIGEKKSIKSFSLFFKIVLSSKNVTDLCERLGKGKTLITYYSKIIGNDNIHGYRWMKKYKYKENIQAA